MAAWPRLASSSRITRPPNPSLVHPWPARRGCNPGDLVFIPGSDGIMQAPGHVGMYIGNRRIVETPQAGQDVKVVRLGAFRPVAAIRHFG